MPLLTTGTATLAPTLKTYYQKNLLENARPELVHAQFGKKYPLPKGNGKTQEWRRATPLPLATTPLAEGVPPTENSFEYTAINVTINQYGAFIKGSDILVLTTLDDILDDISEEQGQQAGQTIETITRDALNAGTTVRYANGRTSRATVAAGDVLNHNEFVLARRTLQVNLAKPLKGGKYGVVIHPMTEASLFNDPIIREALNSGSTGGAGLFNAQIGQYMGSALTVSTMAKVFTAAGAGTPAIDVYSSLFFGRGAFGITELEGAGMQHIFNAKGSAGAGDPLHQYWTSGWKATHAVRILQETYMLRVEHAAA